MSFALLPEAVKRGAQQWPHSHLCAFTGHGLTPSGQAGLWCFLFRGDGVVTGLAYANNTWSVLPNPPVVLDGLPEPALDGGLAVDVQVLAETFCGHAGFNALDGREEDALWVGWREDRVVAVITCAGGSTLTVDALRPATVLAMDFLPVTLPGEPV